MTFPSSIRGCSSCRRCQTRPRASRSTSVTSCCFCSRGPTRGISRNKRQPTLLSFEAVAPNCRLIRETVSLRHRGAVDPGEVGRDLPGGHDPLAHTATARSHRPRFSRRCRFFTICGSKRAVPVPRHHRSAPDRSPRSAPSSALSRSGLLLESRSQGAVLPMAQVLRSSPRSAPSPATDRVKLIQQPLRVGPKPSPALGQPDQLLLAVSSADDSGFFFGTICSALIAAPPAAFPSVRQTGNTFPGTVAVTAGWPRIVRN